MFKWTTEWNEYLADELGSIILHLWKITAKDAMKTNVFCFSEWIMKSALNGNDATENTILPMMQRGKKTVNGEKASKSAAAADDDDDDSNSDASIFNENWNWV